MKIAFAKKVISPKVGTKVAGYGTDDVSVVKLDDLYLTALCMDDGHKKIVILGYDLLGIDEKYIKDIRHRAATVFGGADSEVILSCTHTHTGPNTRTLARMPSILETDYLTGLTDITVQAVREIMAKDFMEVDVYFYSLNCDENINRRFIGGDNRCSFLAHRRDMERIADGICDKELGLLFFFDRKTHQPAYIIGNYAAHPLAGHAPGIGGHRISADFPGAFRDYIEAETGAGCMYLSGAAGDMVPRGHETGMEAIRKVGVTLAQAAIEGVIAGSRAPDRFKLSNESLQSAIEKVTIPLRAHRMDGLPPDYSGQKEVELEIQLVSVGEICLIGVPGELLAELGLEMKWHSPFRKTFILYCSTAYFDYLCHGNALVSGGYEGNEQIVASRGGLMLVRTAVDGAYKIFERTFPDPKDWPDNRKTPLVSLNNA